MKAETKREIFFGVLSGVFGGLVSVVTDSLIWGILSLVGMYLALYLIWGDKK